MARTETVTVAFSDLVGSTELASRLGHDAYEVLRQECFAACRGAVASHNGTEIKTTGDGLMLCFASAADAIACVVALQRALATRGLVSHRDHDRARAVQVAREIVAAIAALPEPSGTRLSVGVGIATGPAFVGNIRPADRFIWTAIGNTMNLAARLQSLTRDLDAAVAIHDTTFRRAAHACADYVRHTDLTIRGRA